MASAILNYFEDYKALGFLTLSISLLHYMHQHGMLTQLSETTKLIRSIYCILLDSLGYARDEIQSKTEFREEIVERKSTNPQLFSILLQMSNYQAKRKSSKKSSKLYKLQKSLSEYKSGVFEQKSKLLTINEDTKEE